MLQERVVIIPTVNAELDRLRKEYNELPEFLSSVVKQVANRINNPSIRAINVVYFPQLGFLVTIQLNDDLRVGDIDEEGLELRFSTEKVAYFKDPCTLQLDKELGDIYTDMIDLEIEIIFVVADQIVSHRRMLLKYGEMVAELDCYLNMAHFAHASGLSMPEISTDSILRIHESR